MLFSVIFFISGFLFAAGIDNGNKAMLIVGVLMALFGTVLEASYLGTMNERNEK